MLLSRIHEWLSSFSHYIESQDACILDDVNKIHSSMIHWMVQIIIRLAPDQDQLSEEARQTIYISSSSADKLVELANKLIEKIEAFSKSLIR
jgi:coenzyme F420-reducing hydrogenase delta subunit